MDLPGQAARVVEKLRRERRALRFEVGEICRSGRFRLSVHYVAEGGRDVRLGLVYSEDRDALQALRDLLSGS